MITWFIGDNSFEIAQARRALEADFDGTAEQVDGSELSLSDLPDLLMGMSLFATRRLVFIKDITHSSALWEKLPDWLPRISDDTHVVFIDTKPDKRTTSYKTLKAAASDVREFPAWTDRDTSRAASWVAERARQTGFTLNTRTAAHLVQRVGVDQWQLAHAIDRLALFDDAPTRERVDDIIPANPHENIFALFETALSGDAAATAQLLHTLELTEDAYATFGLLTSQALNLAAIATAEAQTGADSKQRDPVKDFAIHPFVASKLKRHARTLGPTRVQQILSVLAATDAYIKRSKAEPWTLIEKALLETAQIARR